VAETANNCGTAGANQTCAHHNNKAYEQHNSAWLRIHNTTASRMHNTERESNQPNLHKQSFHEPKPPEVRRWWHVRGATKARLCKHSNKHVCGARDASVHKTDLSRPQACACKREEQAEKREERERETGAQGGWSAWDSRPGTRGQPNRLIDKGLNAPLLAAPELNNTHFESTLKAL
jgi:hypothetical protein